ncbi:MAG: hypothetical protein HEP71_17485 [Roseivirga sp.]|nr:hypothetical protein [Roseivirga sp.]
MTEGISSENFTVLLEQALRMKQYVKLAYFDDIHAFHSVNVVMKRTEQGIELTNGYVIEESWIVSLDEVKAPAYQHIDDFTCDC